MLPNFERKVIKTKEAEINLAQSGSGFPLLLLHGYPQNHLMWLKIAPQLAEDFTVVATDLRGYGDSSKPRGDVNHRNYAKRTMAIDQVEVMSQLGYEEFYLVGHDRGARVAHRLTLDYPEKVKKLVLLDIIPTYELYQTIDRQLASAYYHWFFLSQSYPLPETLIAGNPKYFLMNCLQSWSGNLMAFIPEVVADYIRCFENPATIHATCEDYRAAATIDLVHDKLDLDRKLECPVLILWGDRGVIGKKYDVLSIWQQRAVKVMGKGLKCGHFIAEEEPKQTYLEIRDFLLNSN